MTPPLLEATALRYRYPGAARPAVDDVDLSVPEGALFGVIGPNGSGKSTLVKLLLGAVDPARGEVRLLGRGLSSWRRRELARRVGVVPQSESVTFPVSVREFVGMGRYPHLGSWRSEGPGDRRAVRRAMERCDVAHLAERSFSTLSGGERQLARVARALAQEPELLVLDEPTVSLDVRHGMGIYELLRHLSEAGTTIVMVTHDLNAAARYADRVLLLEAGRSRAEGAPEEVLTRETVEEVYRWPVRVVPHPGPGPDEGAPQVVPLARDPGAGEAPDAEPGGRGAEPGDRPGAQSGGDAPGGNRPSRRRESDDEG